VQAFLFFISLLITLNFYMLPTLIQLATALGTAIGSAIVGATVRYLEKKSIIKHFKKKIDSINKTNDL